MFGAYRFLLAQLVLLGHVRPTTFHFNDAAVINFFMLSGYVMTALIRKNYPRLGRPTLFFYLDRFLRIAPQYLLFLGLTLLCLQLFKFEFFEWHFSSPPSLALIALNLLIVPLNYEYFYSPLASFILIPTAWSLGLEEQFYWFFPFLVLNQRVGRAAIFVSLLIYALAFVGVINSELFGYRTLAGVLFVFMIGKSLADYNLTRQKEFLWTLIGLYGLSLALLLTTILKPELQANYRLEVLSSVAVGLPILALLSRMKRRRFDELLGHTSYGVFLSHILAFNLLMHFKFFNDSTEHLAWAGAALSTLMGYLGFALVEKLVNPLRWRLRAKVKPHAEEVFARSADRSVA